MNALPAGCDERRPGNAGGGRPRDREDAPWAAPSTLPVVRGAPRAAPSKQPRRVNIVSVAPRSEVRPNRSPSDGHRSRAGYATESIAAERLATERRSGPERALDLVQSRPDAPATVARESQFASSLFPRAVRFIPYRRASLRSTSRLREPAGDQCLIACKPNDPRRQPGRASMQAFRIRRPGPSGPRARPAEAERDGGEVPEASESGGLVTPEPAVKRETLRDARADDAGVASSRPRAVTWLTGADIASLWSRGGNGKNTHLRRAPLRRLSRWRATVCTPNPGT